jgi:cytochrome c-type biogenesis protein CcmH/NrfG
MKTLTMSQKSKITQVVITTLLLVVLAGVVGLYLYYGMYLAKKAEVQTEIPTPDEVVEVDERTRRLNILNELAKESDNTASVEERLKTLEDLAQDSSSTTTVSTEERLKILKSLEQVGTTDSEKPTIAQ